MFAGHTLRRACHGVLVLRHIKNGSDIGTEQIDYAYWYSCAGRLKADLSMLSTKQQLVSYAPSGSEYDLLLLALSARLSQWPQLERKAEQVRLTGEPSVCAWQAGR